MDKREHLARLERIPKVKIGNRRNPPQMPQYYIHSLQFHPVCKSVLKHNESSKNWRISPARPKKLSNFLHRLITKTNLIKVEIVHKLPIREEDRWRRARGKSRISRNRDTADFGSYKDGQGRAIRRKRKHQIHHEKQKKEGSPRNEIFVAVADGRRPTHQLRRRRTLSCSSKTKKEKK